MEESLRNKVVLVTGSSGSIGEQTVCYLSSIGAKVVVTGRNAANVERVAEKCSSLSPLQHKALAVICDLTKESDVQNLIQKTIETFGTIDVLVTCAAHDSAGTILEENTLAEFDKQMDVKVRSSMLLCRLALPYLVEAKGSIVNVSALQKPYPTYINMCMVNAMVDMFTKVLALEFAPKGVRVNSVNPGFVDTESSRKVDSSGEVKAWFESVCPLRRMANVDEVVSTIIFFASDYSSFVTGCNLNVEGGFTLI